MNDLNSVLKARTLVLALAGKVAEDAGDDPRIAEARAKLAEGMTLLVNMVTERLFKY